MTNTILQENTPFSVGKILKTSRLEQGFSLEQVSKSLFITKRLLSDLEEDAEHLVCDVYTLGFVKQYAQHLELNATEIVEMFKAQAIHPPNASQLVFPAPLPGRGIPSYRILAVSFFILVAIVVGWKWVDNLTVAPYLPLEIGKATGNMQVKSENPVLPSPPPQAALIDSPLKKETIPTKKALSALESAPPPVNLHTTEDAWIEVKDLEGKVIVSRIFRPGESFQFTSGENLILKTGNLKGTHLSAGEKIFPVSGNSGEVRRDIPLDPEKWLE